MTSIQQPKVSCLMSAILGNRTVSHRLLEALSNGGITPQQIIWFDASDYADFPVSKLFRVSSELESEAVFRRKLHSISLSDADYFIVNGWALALAASGLVPPSKLIIATDATPVFTESLHARINQSAKSLPRMIYGWVRDIRFRKLARTAKYWLPMSHVCAQSLIDDYSVLSEHCSVTYAPQSQILSIDVDRTDLFSPLKLLMVTNLFRLKGGMEVCEAIKSISNVELTIISNDPDAIPFSKQPNVKLISGIKDPLLILDYYRRSHFLVHPTKFDHFPNVILESVSQGCPFITTAGYGTGELIERTSAGWAIAWPPSTQNIVAAIKSAVSDPADYRVKCANALTFSREYLTMKRFSDIVCSPVRNK